MKNNLLLILLGLTAVSCAPKDQAKPEPLLGTWKLLTGMTINGRDTALTDYTVGQEMIKIITPTHFAFMRHDLKGGKDSTAVYVAGGGRAQINGNIYTEYLDYLNYREWEGGVFELGYTVKGDTLITKGVEKVEEAGVDQVNVETYIRVK
ncbi:MAG TPA: hypothetical protein PKE06_15165 [Flavilitoribacter sp.]|nr:hypothetical protein [Flavilitoribacter sp.]HMQ89581.1 hypothetical protein [Flavilitoribacter sp.]